VKTLSRLCAAAALAGVAAWMGMGWALHVDAAESGCKPGSLHFTDEGGVQICAPR
jgi:hypothetical protein